MTAKRPFVIGLTGSIGMGKTTTAGFFKEEGVPVWDADAAVHRLYSKGGGAVGPIGALQPGAITGGAVDRGALKAWIAADKDALRQIEQVVHPLVAADRANFLQTSQADVVVLDVPLLFETGAAQMMDAIVVVTAPAAVQRARVLGRGTMDLATFETIVKKQMPDEEKKQRADYVVETVTLEGAQMAVKSILGEIRRQQADA